MIGYYRVLGPVDVVFAGQVVSFGAAKSRVLLASLLLRANRYVSTSQAMATLWGDDLPDSARATLHTYIMRLRKTLQQHQRIGRCPLRTVPGGYTFEADADSLDLICFDRELCAARTASRAGDTTAELARLDKALSIWRGPALSNVDCDALHRDEVPRLTEYRLKAIERRIDIEMTLRHSGELIAELRTLTAEHPRRERFWSQLIESLYGTGRQSEALAAYQTVKQHLAEELGVDPGPELRGLHLRILNGEEVAADRQVPQPAIVAGREPPAPVDTAGAPPPPADWAQWPANQLPIDADEFTGRTELAAEITAALREANPVRPAIVALGGPPGVGKTALAVHVAWQVRDRFPDGQWFIDLRAGRGAARPATDALAELLQVAGVPRDRMPFGQGALVGALRAALTGRRVLLVLDDADSLDQVAPLLPGAAGCAVLVTGRADPVALTALHGGRSFQVPELTAAESGLLLRGLVGDDRVAREPQAVQGLVNVCGGLPQALRLAAGQLRQQPELSMTEYVGTLVEQGPLDRLSQGLHAPFNLRAAMQAAFDALGPSDRLAFARLGTVAWPLLTASQAAELLDGLPAQAAALLERLAAVHLLRRGPGGYLMAPLQRCFAATLPPAATPGRSAPGRVPAEELQYAAP
ncbi:BTAD domain-containing putative transcriptional regulator [Catellatospora coxensis]|uniref:OmpR/PhoB-type domain-containing protein n=1 Tax=Catellatospora coxensis TaxID=310354 RepID=A0A8J3KS48_9ACTN|nr:AfsR/SARP family transcriptional regulator [Catellatospora coxensis]GIG05107.1 hypothetical protein Cco03nite_18070 [Catellatospora coxensis]